jgi:hypothetical protein
MDVDQVGQGPAGVPAFGGLDRPQPVVDIGVDVPRPVHVVGPAERPGGALIRGRSFARIHRCRSVRVGIP